MTSLKAEKKFFVFTKKTRTTFVTCLFAAQSVFVVCVLARLVVPVMMFLPLLNSPFFSFGLFRIWSTHWHPSGRGAGTKPNHQIEFGMPSPPWWLLFDFLIGRIQMLVLPVRKSNKIFRVFQPVQNSLFYISQSMFTR